MSQCQAKLRNIPSGLLEGWINGREALAGCSRTCAVAGVPRAASLRASSGSEPGCSSLLPRLVQFGQRKGRAARRFLPDAFQLQARDQMEMTLHCFNQTTGVLGAPGRGKHLLLLPPRDPGTTHSPVEKSYREISSKQPNKYLRRVHVCISPIPHCHGFFHQEWMQCRHHTARLQPMARFGGADTVALPISVQKQNQEKQSICHCREVGLMIREEK